MFKLHVRNFVPQSINSKSNNYRVKAVFSLMRKHDTIDIY